MKNRTNTFRSFITRLPVVLALLTGNALLYSAPPAAAAGIAPLGLELGVATLEQSRQKLAATRLEQIGINAYSDGPMLQSNGRGLDVEGLEQLLLIFDSNHTLAGMVMTMADHKFDEVHEFLAKKYPVKRKVIPFVGDRYVKYGKGNHTIELSDPHMSFKMEVRYLTNQLLKAYNQRSAANERERKSAQAGKF